MPRQVFFYDPPERFVAGTVGEPGSRTFFLQARGAGRITSVALEKQQVALLAEQIDKLLDEVLRVTGGDVPVPPPVDAVDDLDPLEGPIEEDFRVGTLALGWDPSAERLVIVAQAPGEDDPEGTGPALDDEEDNPEGPDVLRVRLTGEMARAFARRAQSVVSAGRPSCPFCGLPLDPAGHICPRANGYRR
ncbi:DUF3090 domain-containing protein [Sporichthya polymorpha]|uniref:DUF3090 domain-containing protein n=1 Tax=Sporichthya polymorpha TaxID=35751 RepID=UPI00035FF9EA|nr:DUF3090 domain-containing protein [Sporichthya polymorpha]